VINWFSVAAVMIILAKQGWQNRKKPGFLIMFFLLCLQACRKSPLPGAGGDFITDD
jgi:hypothetical protein